MLSIVVQYVCVFPPNNADVVLSISPDKTSFLEGSIVSLNANSILV